MDEVTALQSRLSRMEGRFRAMAVAWVAGAAVVLVLGIGAQRALSQSQVLNVRELNVVDQSGRTRISLGFGAQSGRPAIWLYDDKGKSRFYIGFGTQRGSPVLLLSDEAGTGRIYLGFSATERPRRSSRCPTSAGQPGCTLAGATRRNPRCSFTMRQAPTSGTRRSSIVTRGWGRR